MGTITKPMARTRSRSTRTRGKGNRRRGAPASRRAVDPLALKIGRHIAKIRIDAGMTQAELVGDRYSTGLLANIETGRSLPSIDALAYLALRLSRSARSLIPGDL